jgi:hypothetical protein
MIFMIPIRIGTHKNPHGRIAIFFTIISRGDRCDPLKKSFSHPPVSAKQFHLCYTKSQHMVKQQFKTTINAPREKVWNILWDDATYRQWTSAFSEGSRAETDWKKGSKVLFLDGSGQGMAATIADNKPNEFMSIKHLGVVKDGVEDYDSPEVKAWAGAMENYTLKTQDGKTELTIDMDITEEYKEMFAQMWPKALAKVKELAEKN